MEIMKNGTETIKRGWGRKADRQHVVLKDARFKSPLSQISESMMKVMVMETTL